MNIQLQNPHEMILEYVGNDGCRLDGACREHITNFLTERNPDEKAKIAISAIKMLINPHDKPDLPDTLERLYCIEQMLRQPVNTRGTEPFLEVQRKSRDHVIHALNTYLLGLLLVQNINVPTFFGFDFQWKIASLFHDIGYPLEIAQKLINQSAIAPLNELVSADYRGNKFCVKFNLSRFTKLTINKNALVLMQSYLTDEWALDANARTLYSSSTRSDKIKHGVVSSLMLMAHIDLLYKKNNPQDIYDTTPEGYSISWARKTFQESVVPACAAILLHDAHKSNFKNRKINKEIATLAWLLRVCDALQDWDRPKSGSNEGISAENYRIGFSDGVIHFKCPQERLGGIWNEDLEAIHEKEDCIQISLL